MTPPSSSRRRPGSRDAKPQRPSPDEAPAFAGATLWSFILITLIWSSTWIVIKGQLGTVPPVWSVSYRFLIAGIAMLVLARLTGASLWLGRAGFVLAALLGTFQFVVNYSFVYASELYITSGLAAVVFALLVAPNAALAWLFFGGIPPPAPGPLLCGADVTADPFKACIYESCF